MLPDPLLAESHAHIHFDGRDFNIATTDRDAELYVKRPQAQQSTA